MHCRACDIELNDYEATLKDKETGEFYDLCSECLKVSFAATYEDNSFKWDIGLSESDTLVDTKEELL